MTNREKMTTLLIYHLFVVVHLSRSFTHSSFRFQFAGMRGGRCNLWQRREKRMEWNETPVGNTTEERDSFLFISWGIFAFSLTIEIHRPTFSHAIPKFTTTECNRERNTKNGLKRRDLLSLLPFHRIHTCMLPASFAFFFRLSRFLHDLEERKRYPFLIKLICMTSNV